MKIRKLPIGISDFKDMVTGNYYYVDKTLFIKEIIDNELQERGIEHFKKLAIVFSGKEVFVREPGS